MNKIYAPLLILLFWVTSTDAQLKVDFTSTNATAVGETIDVDVTVSDFTDIVSMQFSLNWDASVFAFSSIENVTTDLLEFTEDGNIGTPPGAQAVSDGQLTVSWSLGSTQPVSIDDNTRLFTLRLTANGNLCDETAVAISNTPRIIEVVNSAFEEVGLTTTGGAIAIDDGSGNCQNMGMDGIGLFIDDSTAPAGAQVCFPIKATDFNNVESLLLGITWDPTVLRLSTEDEPDGIIDGALTSIVTNIAGIDQGMLRVNWLFSSQAVSVPDGGTLFEICFDVIGDTGESTNIAIADLPNVNPPLEIEISGDGQIYDFFVDNATFTVGSEGGQRIGVGFIADDLYTNDLSMICVPLTTENFDSIVGFMTGISFDESILTYTDFNEGALSGVQVADQNKAAGELRVLWTDQNANPVTLADGSVLVELCFDVIGDMGDRSEIGFINIPPNFTIEAIEFPAASTDFFTDDGSVTVGQEPEPVDSLVIMASVETFDANDTVCVDFTVENYTNIGGMSFVTSWDETILTYVGPRNINLDGLGDGASNFNFVSPDAVRILHTPTSAQTVDDGTSIFQICYVAIPACDSEASTDITIGSDANIALEFIDDNDQLVPVKVVNGSASAAPCQRNSPSINLITLTRPSCPGNLDGAILVEVLNENGSFDCSWTDASGAVITTNCNLAGVAAGMYTLTIIDELDSTAMMTFNVEDPLPIDTSGITVVSCADDGASDGEVEFGFTGGTGAYTIISTSAGTISGLTISDLPAGDVTFMVRDAEGCDYMFTYTLVACGDVDGPRTECTESRTIISPNGDGMNETFVIGCLNDPDVLGTINDLAIYNRWGELVYAVNNYTNNWSGQHTDGTLLDEGGYMWVLTIGSPTNREIYRGTVTLLR